MPVRASDAALIPFDERLNLNNVMIKPGDDLLMGDLS